MGLRLRGEWCATDAIPPRAWLARPHDKNPASPQPGSALRQPFVCGSVSRFACCLAGTKPFYWPWSLLAGMPPVRRKPETMRPLSSPF